MSALNLGSTTGIIYIVLIIVACLVGLWVYYTLNKRTRMDILNETSDMMNEPRKEGGKRRKPKRQRK